MRKLTKKKRIVKELKKELLNKEMDIVDVDNCICRKIELEGEDVYSIFHNDSAYYIKEVKSYAYQFREGWEDVDGIDIGFEIVKDEWNSESHPGNGEVIVKVTYIDYL